MKTVDLRGMGCPEPTIIAFRYLGRLDVGEEAEFLMDSSECAYTTYKLINNTGIAIASIKEANRVYRISVIKIRSSHASLLHA